MIAAHGRLDQARTVAISAARERQQGVARVRAKGRNRRRRRVRRFRRKMPGD